MKVEYSKNFKKTAQKLLRKNNQLANKFTKTLKLLRFNPHHPSLRLHKLNSQSRYSVSIDMSVRIILSIKKDTMILLEVGKHEEVY